MTTDLFAKTMNKKEQLLEFIKGKIWCRTSDIILWGTKNYYNRAERTARDLANEGKIKRMSDDLKKLRFNNTKEDIWEIVK